MNKFGIALSIVLLGFIAGFIVLFFYLEVDVEPTDVYGKWCNADNRAEDCIVLNNDGTFFPSDSSIVKSSWSLIKRGEPLGPAITINGFFKGAVATPLRDGVYPISRSAGKYIFIIDPDANIYFIKRD